MKSAGNFLLLLIYSCYGCSLTVHAQKINWASDNPGTYHLTFATFNHAQMIYDGTIAFTFHKRQLTIHKQFFLSAKDTLLFTRDVTSHFLGQLKGIRLDTLKDFYMNWCVMPISGNEYSVSTNNSGITKKNWLHHYYLKEIDKLITVINKVVPKQYKIRYLNDDPDNYCDWQRFQTIMSDTTAH